MDKAAVNTNLVEAIRNRQERFTLGGCGIRLASDYVRGVLSAAGTDGTVMFPDAPSLLKDAESRLVYRNDEMAYEPPMTSMPAIETYCKSIGVQVPPRTLMVFENVVTSSREDRDGDELLSDGAIMDGKMPLLWHHMLPAVVGKMLAVREQTRHRVRASSAIMESPLGNDVANLIEFGALRISHGFRPLEFTPRDKGIHSQGPKGYRISKFEVLEQSVVSVPSNPEAEIIAWSRGKVHTPVVKSWCRSLYEQRDKVFASGVAQKLTVPIELKIDVRPTFTDEAPQVGAHVIQPAGSDRVVPDYSIGERVPEQGETFTQEAHGTELNADEVRQFIRVLQPGDLVAVQEKTEADVSQDSQAVYSGWEGRVESINDGVANIVKRDGSPARIEPDGRYRALTRQPEPKPEASAMDMLRIEPQPKSVQKAGTLEEQLTPEEMQLGKDAAKQKAEGNNPPNWAVDEELWEKAKAAADKGDYDDETYWPVVVHIYQNMGGTIQGKSKHTTPTTRAGAMKTKQTEQEEDKAVKCPECGKPVAPDKDGKCPDCGADLEVEKEEEDMEKSAHTQTKADTSHGDPMIEMIDAARSAIQVAVKQIDTAGTHVGDVRAYLTTEKAAKPQMDVGATLEAAGEALKGAKSSLGEADGTCGGMKKRMSEKTAGMQTKAGRVLSTANEERLRVALSTLREILEQVEPPAPEGTYKPVADPKKPENNQPAKPAETTANKPTPVELYKPDGALNIQAACQAIVRRMLDPIDKADIGALATLAETIAAEKKSHERAKRRESLRKAFHLS